VVALVALVVALVALVVALVALVALGVALVAFPLVGTFLVNNHRHTSGRVGLEVLQAVA